MCYFYRGFIEIQRNQMTSNIRDSDKGQFTQNLVTKSFVLKESSIFVNVNVVNLLVTTTLSTAMYLYLDKDHFICNECFIYTIHYILYSMYIKIQYVGE